MSLRDQLADIEHQRWADWQRYLHSLCRKPEDLEPGIGPLDRGCLVIPTELVERWERQINTPYAKLSEMERASDLEQVDRYWPLLEASLAPILQNFAYQGWGGVWICKYCQVADLKGREAIVHSDDCPVAIVKSFLGK